MRDASAGSDAMRNGRCASRNDLAEDARSMPTSVQTRGGLRRFAFAASTTFGIFSSRTTTFFARSAAGA